MYRWVEHTGELQLEIESESEEELFTEAVDAIGGLLADDEDGPDGPRLEREITLTAADRPRLLAAWLGELAFLAETEGLVPTGLRRLRIGDGALEATVCGHRGDPPHLIKAVTYHRLSCEKVDGGWRARAVLDV
jgi:SHS2 domain-containing protein